GRLRSSWPDGSCRAALRDAWGSLLHLEDHVVDESRRPDADRDGDENAALESIRWLQGFGVHHRSVIEENQRLSGHGLLNQLEHAFGVALPFLHHRGFDAPECSTKNRSGAAFLGSEMDIAGTH